MKPYSRTKNYGDHDADNLTIGDKLYTQPLFDYAAARKAFIDRWDAEDKRRAAMGKGTQGVPAEAINNYHEINLIANEK